MAIFASTTTSGYSDPLKAMTIKALEARQKDLLAQQAAQQPDMASMATIPGGIGHVLGVVGDQMKQGRADAALAAQKDMLAKTMAGVDWDKGPTAPQIAAINSADPELARQALTTLAENRRAAAADSTTRRGQDTSLQGIQGTNQTSRDTNAATIAGEGTRLQTRVDADKAAAAEAARVAQVAADAQEQRVQARPTDEDYVKLKRAKERNEITQEEFDARAKKLTQPGVPEQKLILDLQGKSIDAQSSLSTLDEAEALLNHPKGIHTGNYAGATQTIGEHVPQALQGSGMLPDPETTKNTTRYNQILGAQALNLLTQMKGASSDKDVQINFKIANDPNAPLGAKRTAIQVLKTALATHLAANNAGIEEAGGKVPKLGGAPAAAATPAPAAAATGGDTDAAAKAWLEKNPNDPRAEAVRKKLGGG